MYIFPRELIPQQYNKFTQQCTSLFLSDDSRLSSIELFFSSILYIYKYFVCCTYTRTHLHTKYIHTDNCIDIYIYTLWWYVCTYRSFCASFLWQRRPLFEKELAKLSSSLSSSQKSRSYFLKCMNVYIYIPTPLYVYEKKDFGRYVYI